MTDVREIPRQVFKEVTGKRQTELHDVGLQTCDMDHGLWLRLDENPQHHNTSLRVVWAWREITGSEVANSKLDDEDGLKMLASLGAGRYETGFHSQDTSELEQTVGLWIPRDNVRFSDTKGAERIIFGLPLIDEIARRSFMLLTLGDYDKAKFWSDELGL